MDISLKRIILFGKEIELLKKFYQENFNCELVEEIKNEWVVVKAGLAEIAFHKIGEEYWDNSKPFKADSNTKLVFETKTDLRVFREKLLLKGILMRDIKSLEPFHTLSCDGEDIEGNVFQLVQKLV
jgi:hypothetical protein